MMFITACSMDDHDEEKGIVLAKQNLFVRSGKYDVELTNDISYV